MTRDEAEKSLEHWKANKARLEAMLNDPTQNREQVKSDIESAEHFIVLYQGILDDINTQKA